MKRKPMLRLSTFLAMMKKVIIAGLYHETHTFLEGRTTLEDFEVQRGEALLSCVGDVSPLAGAVETGIECQWEIVPVIDMRAVPGPIVDDRAVEVFWREFSASLNDVPDGILLVLHGAMVAESLDDVEGEILERTRRIVGNTIPVCGVIDLHSNFTARMAEHSDGLIAYRENPHTDAKAAARDAALLLDRLMRTGERPVTVWHQPRIMWPPTGTATADEPMRGLESLAREIEGEGEEILAANVLAGFAFADVAQAGPSFSVVSVGASEKARVGLQRLKRLAEEKRTLGNRLDRPVEDVLRELSRYREGPIIIAEPSDNIGGGAPGSGNGLLRALLEHRIQKALVVINDPDSVKVLASRNAGDVLTLPMGGRGSRLYQEPLPLELELVSKRDGRFQLEDQHSHLASMSGGTFDMGPCAVVRCHGVHILLTTRKTPPFDLGQLRSQGLNPQSFFVIGVKAAVAHERAYNPIARARYWVDTPGPCSSNLKSYPYRKVRRPVYPLDDVASS